MSRPEPPAIRLARLVAGEAAPPRARVRVSVAGEAAPWARVRVSCGRGRAPGAGEGEVGERIEGEGHYSARASRAIQDSAPKLSSLSESALRHLERRPPESRAAREAMHSPLPDRERPTRVFARRERVRIRNSSLRSRTPQSSPHPLQPQQTVSESVRLNSSALVFQHQTYVPD
jgi:hypothetical protein